MARGGLPGLGIRLKVEQRFPGDIQFLSWSVLSDPRRFGHQWSQCCPLFLRSLDL